jgi:hypothetical protein
MQQFRLSKLSRYSAVQAGARQCTLMVEHALSTKKRLHSEQVISADWIFLKKGGGLAHIREMFPERYFHLMQLWPFTRRWFVVLRQQDCVAGTTEQIEYLE